MSTTAIVKMPVIVWVFMSVETAPLGEHFIKLHLQGPFFFFYNN